MDKRYTLKDLFGTARISSLSLATLFCWFSTSLVFFGLSLNGGNLSGDPYLNTTLNGLAEVVAAFLFMVTNKMSLRPRGSVGLITAGICCLLSIMSTSENQVVVSVGVAMAIIGKLFATFGYTTIGFLTLGTYPTKIRSMAYSTGAAGARLGAMISPFALYLQFSTPWLPSVVFGVLTIIGGFVILLYPETLNIPLITTLQEAEPFYAEEMKFYNKLKGVLLKRKSKRKQSTIPIVGKVNPTFQGDIAENTKPCRIPNSEDIVETEF